MRVKITMDTVEQAHQLEAIAKDLSGNIFIKDAIENKVRILKNTQEEIISEYTKNITDEEKKIFCLIINKMIKNMKGE